jgi:DNA-damage-inducible protein J
MIELKTTNYNVRLDPTIKSKAEETFAAFGLNLSEAINVFLHKSIMEQGFPFDVKKTYFREHILTAKQKTDDILSEEDDV